MVEQRVAVQDRHSRSSRVLALLLALGGGLVLWWTLLTGTAHAAEAPAETPGPGPLAHLVDHTPAASLTQAATHGVTHTVGAVEHAVTHTVRHTVATTHASVTQTVRTTVSEPGAEPVTHAATAVTSANHAVGATTRRSPEPPAHVLQPATQHDAAGTDVAAGRQGPSRPVAAQRADSPAGSSGQPAPTGPSPGAALADDPPTPQLLASGEHSADTRPVLPPEPTYPPGCSPD